MTRDTRVEVRQRATVVHLLHRGHNVPTTADMLAVSPATIYNWYHRWQADGLAGLANQPKSGRPRKATAAYIRLLEEVIEQDPTTLGYDFTLWTVDRLHPTAACLLDETGHATTLPAARQQQRHHLFGAYNWQTDALV